MSRRIRWILLALIVVLVAGAAALFLTQQPKLDDARAKVDTAWKPLRAPDQLVLRYQKLDAALNAFDAAGGQDRDVSKDLHAALAAWAAALRQGDEGKQVRAANRVEAEGTRLVANGLGSERLKGDAAVAGSLATFASTVPNPALVDAYNRAVHDYEDDRTSTLAQPVARVFGFDARPVLALGIGANGS
jgi:hypothetical protein